MIDFTVVPDDGEKFTVKATARDILVWEKGGHKRSFVELMSTLPLGDLYKIAHIAATRKSLYDGNLSSFEKTCDLLFEVEESEPDPTPPAP